MTRLQESTDQGAALAPDTEQAPPELASRADTRADAPDKQEMRFGFGQNWAEYVDAHFSEERVEIAQRHLLKFLKLPDLKGKSFLDIGCGSGIHSLAALRSGAARIFSFDYDPNSVATTRKLWEISGKPEHWHIEQGSVLDRDYLQRLEPADIVYSWGVLHHTGAMWQAIRNAAVPLKDDGVFYIALYCTDVHIDPTPEYWLDLKQRYNRAGTFGKRLMEWRYALRHTILPDLRHGRNPLRVITGYKKSRGMSYWHDVRDWLGGWPMEFAGNEETKVFARDELGLETIHIFAGQGNTEFLFRKAGAKNYWDAIQSALTIEPLSPPFENQAGHCYVAALPQHDQQSDNNTLPDRSTLMLYENGIPVGFAHAPHAHIVQHGSGRYSHWHDKLLFSTTDNSDPNTNGRTYTIAIEAL